MKIGDLIVFFPGAFIGTLAKVIRTNISEVSKEYIEKNHLYHFVKDKQIAEKIIESNHLKPATGLFKNIASYGKAASFMFGGLPTMDSFIKNMSINPYINPEVIINAVEIDIKKTELNNNYKIRPFSDEAIMYEGYCKLPKDRTKIVEVVADLKRDENGKPIIDEKTNKPIGIELRKRTEEEIENSPDKYLPKKDYLEYMKEKKREYGFSKNRINNSINSIGAGGKLELKEVERTTKKNLPSVIKSIFQRFKRPDKLLDEDIETKIERLVEDKSFLERKNPYRDKKFAQAIFEFSSNGLEQNEIKDMLPSFINSKDGMFLRDKYSRIDKSSIGYGIEHSNRVAMLSLIIAKQEGIIKEGGTREREILTTASYYHDIGRILPIGPHAKRGAKLVDEIDFRDLKGNKLDTKDVNIIKLLILAHEGSDNKIDKLMNKFNISEQDKQMVTNLLFVLKDADALDRSRLTINTPFLTMTDLEPKYLRLNTSKRLMEFSYGLENLTHNINNYEDILNYKNENKQVHYFDKEKEFREQMTVKEKGITKNFMRQNNEPNREDSKENDKGGERV